MHSAHLIAMPKPAYTNPFAQIFGVAQSVVVHVAASTGLGRHQDTLSTKSYATYAKSYYAGNILFLATIYFAKASLLFFILRLTPARATRRACQGVLLVITLWIIGTIIAFTLQCNLPRPWDTRQHQCHVNIPALYYVTGVGDILTDLSVIVLPALVVWNVQIPARKRCTVIAVFATRLVVAICAAIRLSTLPRYFGTSDKSWEAVSPQTWIQVIQCLSIITACIPCLKPFLESLESGFMDISMKGIIGPTYGGEYSRQTAGSGKHTWSGTANGSFMMVPLSSNAGKRTNVEVTQMGADAGDSASEQPANFEDTGRKRSGSVPESERALTGKSNNGHMIENDGIRVTMEVEIRRESMDVRSGHEPRNW